MVSRTSDIVGGVDPAQSFDKEALLRYGSANVVGFPTNPSQFTLSQDVPPERRRVIYRDVAQALVVLHSVYVDIVGLGNYGKRTDYCKRQVERWAKQYLLSTGEGKSMRNPKMLELADWLRKHIPLEDSSRETTAYAIGVLSNACQMCLSPGPKSA
ncbi:hypothetical protein K7X08_030449 [Anisodus acutangulus]|uniref:Aminoglycoside phosphotransferase domain-containing protein n=1 Tax=Anisodus acutangulus TaxID=402998 RepID=A0A9Q1QU61_9SOLA|nr:hypothetical protein K7X08_030449 [Anisodus acutangulus]